MDPLSSLRVGDLLTLLAAQRVGSLSGAARELHTSTSQASKAIARLERCFGTRLLVRAARGIKLTPTGQTLVPRVARAISELRATPGSEGRALVELTVAGPSYLLSLLAGSLARLGDEQLRIRAMEMAPALARASLSDNLFDVAVAPSGVASLPPTWTSEEVGSVHFALFGSPKLAESLKPFPITKDKVRALSFVSPMAPPGDRMVAVGDNCPIPLGERRTRHEAHTVGTALEIAAATSSVVFAPVVAARRLVKDKALSEIPVEGWNVREAAYLLCNADRVKARIQRWMAQMVRAQLAQHAR